MGAWGADNFGNDDAGDWIYELEVSKGLSAVLPPLELVVSNDSYLESPDCCIALAASEVVAAGLTGELFSGAR